MKILDILRNAGCKPRHYGTYLTCSAKYRGGDDPGSVGIYLNKNIAKDFVTGKIFNLEDFLKLTLNLKSENSLKDLISESLDFQDIGDTHQDPFSNTVKYFKYEELSYLEKNHSYWNNRNISSETLNVFNGGVCKMGKMMNRYVFPIFDSRNRIHGFSGRDLTTKSKIKWKHVGTKSEWAYPFYFNHKIIKEKKELILVESIGDMLSLWESGIKNTGVTFGTDIGKGLLKSIIRLDPQKIIIATNNDKNFAGQKAAKKILDKLSEFFDVGQLLIKFPHKNDFGEQTIEENLKWLEN
jgi:5S rRNA maturation endonuclease (ribonuclease M5)